MKREKIFLRGIVLITLIGLLFHFGQGILDPQEGLSLQRNSNQQPVFDLNDYQPWTILHGIFRVDMLCL